MPTRITVRYLGSEVGKKVARTDTKGELLELAAKRLNLSTGRPCASLPRMPAWAACGKPHRQRRRSIERRVLPYERPVLHHTRRGCRRTGNVDDTGDVRTTTHFFLSLSLNLTLSLSKVFYH